MSRPDKPEPPFVGRRPARAAAFAAMIVVTLLGVQLVVPGQAGAAPADPTPAQPRQTQPGVGSSGLKAEPGSASLVVPGTGERRAAFTSLNPTGPRALPGSERGRAATLDPAAAAAAKPKSPADGAVKLRGAEIAPSTAQSWYCDEAISPTVRVDDDESGIQTARMDYVAEVGCNVYLAAASGVAGVVDRSTAFDGQLVHVGTPFSFAWDYYGASTGTLVVNGTQYDNARRVEIVFELYLRSPDFVPWGACNPLVNLRYLLCEGLGTDLLHIVVGTGAFDTGLRPPVIEQVALGDSFASGNAADNYYGPSSCFRSTNNYAWQTAGAKTPFDVTVAFPEVAACSGARINDIRNQPGVGLPPKHSTPAQITALEPFATRLVTISVGGNDLNFSDKLRMCLTSDCSGAPLFSASDLQTVQGRLTALYTEIRTKMRSDGVLAVMTYPNIYPAIGDTRVDPTRCLIYSNLITAAEQAQIDQATTDVRDMLARAVAATGMGSGVVLVDTVDALRGHSICSPDQQWASGLDLSDLRIFESHHPNKLGHGAEALRIKRAFGLSEF